MQKKKNVTSIILVSLAVLGMVSSLSVLISHYNKKTSTSVSKDIFFPSHKFKWEKNVLFLSSYDFLYPATKLQMDSVEKVFNKNQIHFDTVFMDSKLGFDESSRALVEETIVQKMNKNVYDYDALLVADDEAFVFALDHKDSLFKGLPVVYMGVSNLENIKKAQSLPNVTGFSETHFLRETIEAALALNPDRTHVIGICDDTLTGQGDARQFEEIADSFEDISFEIINVADYTFEQLSRGLQFIPEKSIVIMMNVIRDKNLQYLSLHETVQLVCDSVRCPVFSCTVGGIGDGQIGGMIFDFSHSANLAANAVVALIQGTPVNEIDTSVPTKGYYCFDLEVARRFGYRKSQFPSDSVFVYGDGAELPVNRAVFFSLLVIFLCLLMIVGVAVLNYYIAQKRNVKLLEKNREIEEKNELLKASELRFHYLSENDYLTSLPNRFTIVGIIRELIERKADFNVMMLDVDDFKFINDYYTHACGDFVLCNIGTRLLRIASDFGCHVARYGGDEFLVVDEKGVLNEGSAELERMRSILCESLEYNKIKMDVFISAGVAHFDPDLTYDELMGNADLALYESKKNGKNRVCFYETRMRKTTSEKNRIVKIIDEECSNQGFTIRYQPQVDARTGEVLGFEALVRLTDCSVGPAKFIPIAEDSGYITQIGRIVTEKVIAQMARWRENGMKLQKVAINYSNGQLVDSEYVEYLKEMLEKYDVPPTLLEIEITESLFLGNNNLTSRLFKSLSDLGVSLVLDDFGTGYSSLSYLTYVPVTKVKIDKSIVDNYLVDGKEIFILDIVRLVHDMGMELTVEGVEHQWQYEKLRSLHCDTLQGFYFSKPITAEEVESLQRVG